MINPDIIAIGKKYRNKKTQAVYEVILISRSSEEALDFLVSYSKDGDQYPWTRPLHLFVDKFEEVSSGISA